MLDGTHDADTPDGSEFDVRSTVPVNPAIDRIVTVVVADPPTGKDTLVGLAEIEKSGVDGSRTIRYESVNPPTMFLKLTSSALAETSTLRNPFVDELHLEK